MKTGIFLAAICCCMALCGKDILAGQEPNLRYEVTFEFATEVDAQASTLQLLPLPEGKKVAFSTRWDDRNPKHVRMAELLTRYGFRGTFFLTEAPQKFYDETLPKLIVDGHTIGNHTLNHPNLTSVIPNEGGRQILRNRVEYEARTDQEINTFVLPGCAYKNEEDKESPLRIGDFLRRSGELGSPEFSQNLEKEYHMRPGSWASSRLFSIDDRNPKFEVFEKAIADRLKLLKTLPTVHMTLGLHTWQDDEGFKILAKCFDAYKNRPDWWYCNENEYTAYYYAFMNTRITGKRTEGTKAVFILEQLPPSRLGSAIPLWAEVTPPVKGGKNMVSLQRPPLAPEKIDALVTHKGKLQEIRKFPGLSASLEYNPKQESLQLKLNNRTGKSLTRLEATYRLPPRFGFNSGTYWTALNDLPEKQKISSDLLIGTNLRDQLIYQTGKMFFAVEINFFLDEKPQRLWVCCEYQLPKQEYAVPRDQAMKCEPFQTGTFDPANTQWLPHKSPDTLLPGYIRASIEKGKEQAFRFKVNAGHKADYHFHVTRKKELQALYLNGKQLSINPFPSRLPLEKGINELIVVLSAGGVKMICISRDDDPNYPLPYER